MKLTTLDEDLRIHQKLEDEPNDVGGLSAQELKKKFDQAGVTIQKYLNETHLPEEEAAVADALGQAKAYTDQKAAALEQGNMKTGVYDPKGRRRDIFDYTDEKVETLELDCMKGTVYDTKDRRQDVFDYADGKVKALEQESMKTAVYDTKDRQTDIFDYTDEKIGELDKKKGNRMWFCAGTCSSIQAKLGETKQLQRYATVRDPDKIWSEEEHAFTVPEGATSLIAIFKVGHSLGLDGMGCVQIVVNGKSNTFQYFGGFDTNPWATETWTIPMAVTGGDKLTIEIKVTSYYGSGETPKLMLQQLTMLFFA